MEYEEVKNCKSFILQDFNENHKVDVIINCIGSSNSSQSREFFELTQKYDSTSINYLKKNPNTKYIFFSSGAIFGDEFLEPINQNSFARVQINSYAKMSWYGISKLYAECQHRSLIDHSIVDLRIFSYFSHLQNLETNLLMSQVVKSLKSNKTLLVSSKNIVRDYVTSVDLFNLIEKIIEMNFLNMAIDSYSLEPISKFTLLENLSSLYGLKYEIDHMQNYENYNSLKLNYYSTNKIAGKIGYIPKHSSLTGIFEELNKLNIQKKNEM